MIYVLSAHYLSLPAQLYSTKLFNSFVAFFNIPGLSGTSLSVKRLKKVEWTYFLHYRRSRASSQEYCSGIHFFSISGSDMEPCSIR
jgi:hypothetical protein